MMNSPSVHSLHSSYWSGLLSIAHPGGEPMILSRISNFFLAEGSSESFNACRWMFFTALSNSRSHLNLCQPMGLVSLPIFTSSHHILTILSPFSPPAALAVL